MTEVVVARLDVEPGNLCALLSADERQRAQRFRFERDRRRFVVARARLREELAARLGVKPERVALEYGENGKPRLAGRELHFSVSHCDDVALLAFSKEAEVGVDVEAIRPVREADAIATQFFTPAERAAYSALSPRRRVLGFLRLWTRKEAFVKALGSGFSLPLERLDLWRAPRGWRLQTFFPLRGFIAALASPHG